MSSLASELNFDECLCDLQKHLGFPAPDRNKDDLSNGMQFKMRSTLSVCNLKERAVSPCLFHLETAVGCGWASGSFVDETALSPVACPCRQCFLATALRFSSFNMICKARVPSRLMRTRSPGWQLSEAVFQGPPSLELRSCWTVSLGKMHSLGATLV